jgi:hypothetical protein
MISYLRELDYDDWKRLSLLDLAVRSTQTVDFFSHGVQHQKYAKYGDVLAAGTGATALFRQLDQVVGRDSPVNEIPLLVAGALALTSEFFSIKNLKQGYGGGYEFLYPSDGRIHALDNIVYVIWFLGSCIDVIKDWSSARKVSFQHSAVIIKQTYVGDILIIIRSALEKNTYRGKTLPLGRGQLNLTAAAAPCVRQERMAVKVDFDAFDKTNVVCSVFAFHEPEGYRCLVTVDAYPEEQQLLTVHYDLRKRETELLMKPSYWERVLEQLKSGQRDDLGGWG